MSTPEVSVDDLATARDEDADLQLVDVRQPGEYAEVRVPGAVSIPMDTFTQRLGEIDRDRPVYVICAVGGRSLAVTDYLVAQGYDARSVAGGTRDWYHSGRPVDTGRP